MVTPESNIHAPDENLSLSYCWKLMMCVGTVVAEYQWIIYLKIKIKLEETNYLSYKSKMSRLNCPSGLK